MQNVIHAKRGLILILVLATIAVFIGIVWLILANSPWALAVVSTPSQTPASLVQRNCTYPISYWIDHPEYYPSQIVIGEKVYRGDEILSILSLSDQSTISQIQRQLVGAFLNTLAGANQSLVDESLNQAYGWVVDHPDDSLLTASEREAGRQIIKTLEAFNLGQGGVVACQGGIVIPTAAATSPSGSVTLLPKTPTQTQTPTPSMTVPATVAGTAPIFTYAVPSFTPTWTQTAQGGWYPTETFEAPSATPTEREDPTWTTEPSSTPATPTVTKPPPATPTPSDTPVPTRPPAP